MESRLLSRKGSWIFKKVDGQIQEAAGGMLSTPLKWGNDITLESIRPNQL